MSQDPYPSRYSAQAMQLGAVGLEMGVSVAIGTFGGAQIDTYFNCSPWGVLIGAGLGMGAAALSIVRLIRRPPGGFKPNSKG